MKMNKLNRFYLSQNISIDNALSMNQILHQIVNQIKEIVDFINNLELRANEYTESELKGDVMKTVPFSTFSKKNFKHLKQL